MEQAHLFFECRFCGGDPTAPDHWRRCDGQQGRVEAAAPADPYPPFNATDTSQAAAATVAPDTATMRAHVEQCVQRSGPYGLTCDDVEQRLGLRHQTASARLWELHHKLGVIADSGRRRRTASGRLAIVYVCRVSA